MRTLSAAETVRVASGSYAPALRVSLEDAGGVFRDVDSYFGDQRFLMGVSLQEDVDGQGPTASITLRRQVFEHSLSPLMLSSGTARGYNPSASPSPPVALYRRVKVEFYIAAVDELVSSPSWTELFVGRIDRISVADGESVTLECRDANVAVLSDSFFERERLYGLTPSSYTYQKGCLIWAPGETQAVGDICVPAKLNGYLYRVTGITTGITGSTQPNWPTVVGNTVVDGGVTWTCGVATASAGTVSMETVLQQMLNDSPVSLTLYAPDATSFLMSPWKQEREPVLESMRKVAQLIGWDLRPRYDSGGTYRFQLYKPDRAASSPVRTFAPASYVDVSALDLGIEDVRNVVRVVYGDSTDLGTDGKTPKRKYAQVSDASSISAYGRRFMEIAEEATSQIDTAAEATALANAALSDLATPYASLGVEAFFFPWAQLGDLYRFSANNVHFDSDQDLAVVGYSHEAQLGDDGEQTFRTSIQCRGKPSGGSDRWLQWDSRPGVAPTHSLQDSMGGADLTVVDAGAVVGGARFRISEKLSRLAKWDGVELHISTSSGFAPSSTTLAAYSKAETVEVGNLTPGTTYYARIVPRQLNAGRVVLGEPSEQVSFTAGYVTTAKLDAGAVTTAKLADLAVTEGKLGALAVSSGKLQDSAVTTAKLNALAVDSSKLAAAAVTTAKIATGAVTSNELGALAVTTAKIAAGAVTSTELGSAAVTTAKLAAGAVTSNELAAAAVTTAKIATGAVTANELGSAAVTEAKLGSGAVTTAKIAASAVTSNELGASAVTEAKLGSGAVTEAKLGAGAVTTGKLADGAVSKGKLASASVSPAKLELGIDFGAVPLNGDFTSWTAGSGSPPDGWAVNTGTWGTDVARSAGAPFHLVFPDTATSGTLTTDDLRVQGNYTSLQVRVYGYAGNGYSSNSDFGMKLEWYTSARVLISSNSYFIKGAGIATGGSVNTSVETTVSPPSNAAFVKVIVGRLSRDRTNTGYIYLVSAKPVNVLADGSVTSAKLASDIAVTGTLSSAAGATFATSGGNVGIGTTSPGKQLSVVGQISAAPSGTGEDVAYHGSFISTKPSTANQHINIVRAGNKVWSIGFKPNSNSFLIAGGESSDSGFGNNHPFLISDTGNVGIGETSPGTYGRLEVKASGYAASSVQSSDASGSIGVIVANSSSEVRIGALSNHPLWLMTNGIERVRVTNSGSVGIGTAGPNDKLDVSGTVRASGSFTPGTSAWTGAAFRGQGSYGGGLSFIDGSSGFGVWVQDGGATFAIGQGSTGGGLTERFRINSGGHTVPGADNTYTLGASGARWSQLWAGTTTINTSDERQKTDIVESDLGLDFIESLRPVRFRFKVGQNVVQQVPDGENEDGTPKYREEIVPVPGKRPHYGFLAQHVAAVLGSRDFAGFIHDEETDTYGLRYSEFIAPLVKAVQELSARVRQLEQQLAEKESP